MKKIPHLLASCSPLWLGALALTAALAPSTAQAQGFAERFSIHLEGGLGLMVVAPQTDLYGLGYNARASAGLRLVGPIGLYAFGGHWAFGGKDVTNPMMLTVATPVGRATIVGAGLRLDPEVSRTLGRLRVEVEAGYSINGADELGRLYVGAGIGWMFPVLRVLDVGPMLRFGEIFAGEAERAANGGTGNAAFATAGISLGLHGPREEPPPPVLDTDGDGVLDPQDACPTVPQGEHPDPARPGCPAQDTDSDGVFDPEDVCPMVPQGDHPDAARRGCPLGDRDSDGVFDDTDRCPDQPEDRDQFEDEDGCPDPDNDHDTILDAADRCPIQPETPNGFEDEDGCPDEAPPTAVVVEGHINVNQPVYFDTDLATIQTRSFPILDQVASVLTTHPELRRIRIEGNTDDTGDVRHNLRLSRDRAAAVMTYLRGHGVTRNRMTSLGYGATRPAAPGESQEARALNRRVDFVIVGGPSAAPTGTPPTAPPPTAPPPSAPPPSAPPPSAPPTAPLTTPPGAPVPPAAPVGRHHGGHRRGH